MNDNRPVFVRDRNWKEARLFRLEFIQVEQALYTHKPGAPDQREQSKIYALSSNGRLYWFHSGEGTWARMDMHEHPETAGLDSDELRFIQITVANYQAFIPGRQDELARYSRVYGLDENGQIFQLDFVSQRWRRAGIGRHNDAVERALEHTEPETDAD